MRLRPPYAVVKAAEEVVAWCLAQKSTYTPTEASEALRAMMEEVHEAGHNAIRMLEDVRTVAYWPHTDEVFVTLQTGRTYTCARLTGPVFREADAILSAPQAVLPY